MISKIKKPVSILLSLIMVFSMFAIVPFTASAAENGLYVNNVYANTTTSGTGWSYNVQTNTLTLNNYNFNGVATIPGIDPTVIMYYPREGTFTIELKGTNTIVQGDSTNRTWWGIYSRSDLVITGDGTLNISTANGGRRGAAIYGEKNVTIDGNCTVNATSGTVTSDLQGYGVGGGDNSSLTIGENAKVTLTGPKGGTNMTVKNAAPGLGWTDTAGTTGKRFIEASTSGQNLISYKKVQFPAQAVASVTSGGTTEYYQSLKDAITAAPNGSTVTLLKDVTETQTAYANNNDTYGGTGNVISGKTITITSNGTGSDRKTVTGSRFDVKNGGNVTFTNIIIDGGVADSAHKITSYNSWSNYFMVVSYGSTLTFDTGATVQNYYAAAHGVIDVGNGRRGNLDTSNGSSTINIKDGSEFKNLGANYGVFREDYKSTINMSGGSVTNCTSFSNEGVCAYVAQGSAFNMTGGEITGCSPEGTAPGLIFLHDGQANGNNKFNMTGGTISGNTAKLGGAVYSHNVNNTITVGGSAVATGNTGTDINNGQSGSSNFYLAAGQTMTIESDNHLSGDSLIGIYSATAPTDSADVKIATGAVKDDIKHIHSDLPGNAGIIYCDGEKDWIWYNNQFVEVSCHHTSHQSGTVWLSTAVNTYEVTFDTDGGTPATIPAQTVVSNSKATKPADPTKDSYMFDGWYNGDTEFDFDTPITADTNLKAKWSVPVASVTSNGTTTNYTDFGTAVSKWTNGSTLTLLADVQANSTITVSGTRTLDLNGYGITKSNQGRLFNVDGNLTINDSNPTRSTHKYTVDETGLAVLNENGTQSFQGGYITGGHGYTTSGEYGWGGFAIVDLGHKNQNYSLTINGGTIIGNKTDLGGGGVVRVNSNGIFTMNGGAIIYNTTATDPASENNDGAVSGEPNVKFYIRGGTIAHNTTKGGVTSDLYLANNQKVIVDGELDSATSIGIKMQNGTGVFTNSSTTDYNVASKFKSDNVNYKVVKNADGQLELRKALFVGHNITLNGDIGVNFFINSAYADFNGAQTATVVFTWDNGNYTKEVNLKDLTPDANGYYKATCDVVAAHMAHKIHAVVYLNGAALDETNDFSVQDYAEKIYKNPDEYDDKGKPKQLKALAKALLNYGAMAQIMFDTALKEKPNLANKNVGATDLTGVTAEQVTAAIKQANDQNTGADMTNVAAKLHANWYTTTVIYLSKNTVKHYFTKADDSFNATAYQGNQNNYYYFVQKEDIAAAELDTLQEFKVGDYTFKYSALDYVVAVINSNMSDNAKNIAKALFLYNQAANAYFD